MLAGCRSPTVERRAAPGTVKTATSAAKGWRMCLMIARLSIVVRVGRKKRPQTRKAVSMATNGFDVEKEQIWARIIKQFLRIRLLIWIVEFFFG